MENSLFNEYSDIHTTTQRRAQLDMTLTRTVTSILDQNKLSGISIITWGNAKTLFNNDLRIQIEKYQEAKERVKN